MPAGLPTSPHSCSALTVDLRATWRCCRGHIAGKAQAVTVPLLEALAEVEDAHLRLRKGCGIMASCGTVRARLAAPEYTNGQHSETRARESGCPWAPARSRVKARANGPSKPWALAGRCRTP